MEFKREMDKILSRKRQLEVGLSKQSKDHGRRVLKKVLMKVYETGMRAPLDSGILPNVLSKEFVDRFGSDTENTKQCINAVTGENSPVEGMLKNVPIRLKEKIAKLNFFVVEGSPFDVIVGDPTMENLKGVLDLENRVTSFGVDGAKIEIPMDPD